MEEDILFREKLKSSAIIIFVGLCFGLVYWVFGDDWNDTIALLNGVTIGVLGGVILALFEYFVFRIDSRRWTFMSLLIVKTVLYFSLFAILILSVISYTGSIEHNQDFWEYFFSDAFQEFIFEEDFSIILIYCLTVLIIINFTRQINRKIGYGVLLNMIFGKYHIPAEEERVFAYVDLKQSTFIAEQLGALKFHKLLYEFFYDISMSILMTKGEIYRYVGDEIVVSWTLSKGLSNANCVRSYFLMKKRLKDQREKYLDNFGFLPDFHAAFHSGQVIRGEIGDIKSQVVYHGETMFVASRMEKECSRLGIDILISSTLMQQLSIPIIYEMKHIGGLEGNADLELYTITEKELEVV